MAMKAKHAFGALENIDSAISNGVIDAYDILFVKDADGKPYVGWVDSQGQKVIVDNETDLSGVEADISELETELATKVTAEEVDAKVKAAISSIEQSGEKVDYVISHKPEGTLVDYRDKEIRVMIPAETQFELQNSGAGSDANLYYIGFKAYAYSDDVVSFKEDLAEIIADDTMYYFEGNDFAGEDENGKYSIVWLPVAKYDESTGTWTYYGANSSEDKYIGWYYSVEWYDANGVVIASDCIRINLSNENCHSSIEPYYVNDVVKTANAYTDEQIEAKIAEMSGIEIVEF